MNVLLAQRLLSPSAVLAAGAGLLFFAPLVSVGDTQVPHTFQAGTKALAAEVNANFDALMAAVDDLRPANRIVVATDGGDFDSVADALASITDAAEDNPYVVWVAPGVYDETDLCVVPAFVSLVGESATSTRVTSSLTSNVADGASATLLLEDQAALVGLTIENTGSASISTAVYGEDLSRATRIAGCVLRASGGGGIGHFGVKVEDSDLTIVDSLLQAEGATIVNSAFACVGPIGSFAQPRLVDCVLEADGPASGIGAQLLSTSAAFEGCVIAADFRGITGASNGSTTLRDSEVRMLNLNPVFELTGSSKVLSATTRFEGGNPIGLGSSSKYVHCFKANFDPIVNGTGSVVQ